MEFLTTFDVAIPDGTPGRTVEDAKAREAQRARELADEGHLLRFWMPASPPRGSRAFGLWQAQDAGELEALLQSLPMNPWMTVAMTPLSEHPSEPQLEELARSQP